MKKILLGMAAVSALAAAAPAVAQGGQRGYNDYDIQSHTNVSARIAQLQVRLDSGVRNGSIRQAEAAPLYQQLRNLQELEIRFRRNGISGRENAELQHRINDLRQALYQAESRPGWGRDDDRWDRDDRRDDRRGDRIDRNRDGYDDRDLNRDGRIDQNEWRMARDDRRDDRWDDRDDRRDDRSGGRIDRNRDGYDDRDLNRDGRISESEWRMARDDRRDDRWDDRDDRWEDRDDRWEERRDNRRGGIGGVIEDMLGVGGLRVGQRVTANARLGAVPYEYRNRFRDGRGVYYRSDGRSIYQIDARTNVVLRIYDIRR